MPLQATSGAASYDAFGGGVPVEPVYIEQIFSTYLYTGTGATQTITNNIDLSTKGGLVWQKTRSIGTTNHVLCDTARGVNAFLFSNDTLPSINNGGTDAVYSYNANGFSTGTVNGADINLSGETAVSWTFRKQTKFFDVVTYTGNGTNPRNISHNLGSVPGCVIAKRTDAVSPWRVYHRGISPINDNTLALQSTAAASDGGQDLWGNGATVVVPTSTVFTVSNSLNTNGATYVAYLFAHNAGGFGLTGTDNVISCGTFTTDGSGNFSVNLGYEPQWIMAKRSSSTGNWNMYDNMRGLGVDGTSKVLYADLSNAEAGPNSFMSINSTGFGRDGGTAGQTFIYIAIRRGPMKVPTLGTSVYNAIARTGTGAAATVTGVGFSPDLVITGHRTNPTYGFNKPAVDRLRGPKTKIYVDATASEGTTTDSFLSFNMDGFSLGADGSEGNWNENSATLINWNFRRAPGFFDEVCYTGDGTTSRNVTHNLTVQPELVVVKSRSNGSTNWVTGVYANATQSNLWLNSTAADGSASSGGIIYTQFSNSSTFRLSASGGIVTDINTTSATYVAYLFATCAGVSKVGSYTGNGSTQTINCGFTGGARFVLIKRTDSTGDWYVWDSARGIVAGNDPHLSLNTTAAEVTTDDSVDTDSTGFVVNQLSATNINVTSASYIFLSVA